MATICTIGYSHSAFPDTRVLLGKYGIERLVDVRSNPKFRVKKGYSAKELEAALGEGYRWEPRLGGKYGKPDAFQGSTGPRHPGWREALDELTSEAAARRVCIMCKEEDPSECHRGQWIQPELEARGVRVVHIRR